MSRKIRTIFTLIILALSFVSLAFAQQESQLYSSAVAQFKVGNDEFAFLNLFSLIRSFPQSKYLENSLFAIGEYHYADKNYAGAAEVFSRIVEEFPDSKSTVFAMAYLLKIAQMRDDAELAADLGKAIATFHKLSLVFRNSKAFTYRSVSMKKYKADYYIDKVEFYKNGELFAQVSY
jgi:TolA-binding protein